MLSWPQLSSALVEAKLSGAAEEIVNALEYAQLSAMTSGRNTKFGKRHRKWVLRVHATSLKKRI
jgi:Tfp pilus assembly protein FimT